MQDSFLRKVIFSIKLTNPPQMIGYNLVTKQTTPQGSPVSNVMVAKALNIVKETYLAIVLVGSLVLL